MGSQFLSRRELFRTTGYAATTLTLGVIANQIPVEFGADIPLLPRAYAQSFLEYDVGTLTIPVTKDGKIGNHEYDDCVKTPFQTITPNPNARNEISVHSKYDSDTTYFGFDFVNSSSTTEAKLSAIFDLKKSNAYSQGAPDVYNLDIKLEPSGSIPSYIEGDSSKGTALKNAFKKGTDYDFQTYIGPSADSSSPHKQLEVQIKNDILQKYSNEILFDFTFEDYNFGVVILPQAYPCTPANCPGGTGLGIMKFVNNTLPEIYSAQLLAAGVLAFPLLLTKWKQRRMIDKE